MTAVAPPPALITHTHIPHVTRIPPTPSPSRPRLLYRGALRLVDGTILRGVAFVSTVSPFDSSTNGDSLGSINSNDADLCLALEMIRRDRSVVSEGILIDQVKAEDNEGCHGYEVHYESTFHVRMYIDPKERCTVDFFERAFTWPGSESEGKVFILHTNASLDGPGPGAKQSTVIYAKHPTAQEQGHGPVQIVVGRRILKRKVNLARSSSSTSMMLEGTNPTTTMHKPDDPMPRVFMQPANTRARPFERSASAAAAVGSASGRRPEAVETILLDKAPPGRGNHTPGRRGEKRVRPEDAEDVNEMLKKRTAEDSAVSLVDKLTTTTTSTSSSNRTSIETSNRSTLKRLITHQLLGHGYCKKDDEFNVCFQATYSGSCTALRRVIREKSVDRMDMARIVSEHLDLYVRRVADL